MFGMPRSHERRTGNTLALGISSAALAGLALAGCSSPEMPPPATTTPGATTAGSNTFTPRFEFQPNGTRVVFLERVGHTDSNPIVETCDGIDLLALNYDGGQYDSAMSDRTVGHPACSDGRLDPADFALPAQ